MNRNVTARRREKLISGILLGIASVAVMGVFLIFIFVVREGWPIIAQYGLLNLLGGREWSPTRRLFGLLPLIIGSFWVTLIALALGVPLGLGGAVFMAEIAPGWMARIVRPAINLLAGIPSVVYGFFGLTVMIPWLGGLSLFAGGLILAVMILPTIISISEDALRATPGEYREASLALGATHWQTIYKVTMPAAKSGILAAIILGMGRAFGETMAVIMITGNTPLIPASPFDPGRTLPGTIGLESAYATPEHSQALFMVGMVLFLIIMLINSIAILISGGRARRNV